MALISVIVPIYNKEKLMRKCLDSILAQTFTDYECLLIDDGSKDGSPAICDEYAAKDARFKAFHKPNGGLSDARNYGLARAQGKYTIFADPDDWLSPNGLDVLYEVAEQNNADMTICDYYQEDRYVCRYVKQKPSSLYYEDVLKDLFSNIHGSTCNKLIKRDLYQKYNVKNPIGMYGCEDQYVMASFLKHDIKIAYCPVAFYHYVYTPQSLTRKYDQNTYQMNVRTLQLYDILLKDTSVYQKAVDEKKYDIIASAFYYGRRYYSSKLFKEKFASYIDFIKGYDIPRLNKTLIVLSCKGFYRMANFCFHSLFNLKQLLKMIRYGFCKKNI